MSVVRSTVRPPLRRSPHGWHQSTESRAIHRLISHGNTLRLPQCYSLSQNSPRDRCNAASSAIPLPLTQPAGAGSAAVRHAGQGRRSFSFAGSGAEGHSEDTPLRDCRRSSSNSSNGGGSPRTPGSPSEGGRLTLPVDPPVSILVYSRGCEPFVLRVDIGIKFQCTLGRMVMLPTRPNSRT